MLTYCNNFVPLEQLKTINMPRQARKTSGTGIYHVMLRGINRQDIFEDDEDYMRFLQKHRSEDSLICTEITVWHR